ncbi:NPC intracellular cholesterol transporter 1-like [Dermacentor variabilis]|uniref:NPC intracellular cholesterol transporter 1-like n=1 Tax=Dermacentor variabilis TaxID=34621 RepID=UPI003F5B6FB9
MSSRWLFIAGVSATLISSALAHCILYGHCGKDKDTGRRLPCAVERDPVNIESTLLQKACPALLGSAGEPVPACCDANQAGTFKSQFGKLVKLGLGRDSKCFRNLQNLVCQAFCSPKQSNFVAVFGNSAKGKREPSATEIVYAVEKNFAEVVYASCKDVRTRIFGIKLLYYMCGKYGSSKCSPQHFLDFLGARPSEGGHSPLKIRYVIAEAPVKVNGKTLEPFKADVF